MDINRLRRLSSPRAWALALLIGTIAFSLVIHLNNRFPDHSLARVTSAKCNCLQAQWQYLERDALRWISPPPQISALPALTEIASLPGAGEEIPVMQDLAYDALFDRPPPFC